MVCGLCRRWEGVTACGGGHRVFRLELDRHSCWAGMLSAHVLHSLPQPHRLLTTRGIPFSPTRLRLLLHSLVLLTAAVWLVNVYR